MKKEDYVTHEELSHAVDNLSNQIRLSESNLAGKIDRLTDSVGSQSKILWWIMSIISAGIIVPIIGITIRLFIK